MGDVFHVPSLPGKGEKVADRPDEGLTWSLYEPEYSGFFPPHPSPHPRGKRAKLENQLRGRGDNREKILSIISDCVKYNSEGLRRSARRVCGDRERHSPDHESCDDAI